MTTDSQPRFPIEALILIIATLMAICAVMTVVGPEILPQILRPTSTTFPPTASPLTGQYSPEVIPALTDTPEPAQALAQARTSTPGATITFTPTFTTTDAPINGSLPDLTVTGISRPICVPDRVGSIIEFSIYVWNIGRVPTRSFGSFNVGVFLILGQRHYGLDEWRTQFNGVVGNSNLEISNLRPNEDIKLTVVIDLKGNNAFGIQAIANSGANTIPETDTTNNTLTKYFSIYCY